jgi:hypothetical protein
MTLTDLAQAGQAAGDGAIVLTLEEARDIVDAFAEKDEIAAGLRLSNDRLRGQTARYRRLALERRGATR